MVYHNVKLPGSYCPWKSDRWAEFWPSFEFWPIFWPIFLADFFCQFVADFLTEFLNDYINYLPGSNCTWKSDRFCHRWITFGVSVTNQVDSTIFSAIIWPFNQHLQKEFCNFTETEVLASNVCRHMVKPFMPRWAEIILEVAFSFFQTVGRK